MAAFGLALLALYRSPRLHGLLAPLDAPTARVTAALVGASGLEVERRGAVLAHPGGFSYEIYYRCTGLVVAACLAAGLAALPGRAGGAGGRRAKLLAVVVGAALVLALNFGRLAGLYWIGVRHPGAFDFAHRVVGEAGMLAAVGVYWLVWLRSPLSTGR
jgi:exosortase/archaeosortase family protein